MKIRRLALAAALLLAGCPRTPPAPPPRPAAPLPPVALPQVNVSGAILANGSRFVFAVPDAELPRVAALWLALLEGDDAATALPDGGLRLNRSSFLPGAFGVIKADNVLRELNGRPVRSLAGLRELLRAAPADLLTVVFDSRSARLRYEYRPASQRPPPPKPREDPLADAVRENALDRLRVLLDWGANPEPFRGIRPLYLAVLLGRVEAAGLLLESGAALRRDGDPSLLLVAVGRVKIDPALVRVLLRHGADPNDTDPADGRSALLMAAWAPPAAAVSALVEAGAKVDVPDRYGYTPLAICAGRRDTGNVRLLLEKGADPNLGNPLARAIRAGRGDPAAIRILLERGADPGRMEEGGPALIGAAQTGELEVLTLLLDKGVDPDTRTRNTTPMTALQTAAGSGKAEAVGLLRRRGAAVDGWALVQAAKQGHVELVKTLAPLLPARDLSTALAAAIEARKDAAAAALLGLGAKDLRGEPRGLDRALFSALTSAAIDKALADGADPRARDREGRTPLLVAIAGGRLEQARLLLQKGAPIDDADPYGQSALWMAADRGDAELVRLLLDRGADLRIFAWGMSILERIQDHGRPHVEYLLRAKGAPGLRRDGAPPVKAYASEAEARADQDLIEAVSRKDPARLQEALDRGADSNVRGRDFRPVLLAAVQSGNPELLIPLLQAGADVHAAGPEGERALHTALHCGPVIVRILLGAGADVDAAGADGATPLMKVFSSAAEPAAPDLIERCRNVNARSRFGQTALSSALASPECVAKLLQKGADPDTADNEGKTALMSAAEQGWTETLRLLLGRKARVDLLDRGENRWTALHYAAAAGRLETARLLVEGGAAVQQRSGRDERAADLARRRGHADLAAFLENPAPRR